MPEHRFGEVDFASFLEAVPDAMVVVGADGRIVLANGHAERLFGYARGELVGETVERLVPAQYRDQHPRHRAGYSTTPRARPMGAGVDLFGLRKDGTEFPAEISLGPVETARGMLVMAAIRDVTPRRRAEEVRSRLAAIVDSSDDAIIGKALDGTITSWNHGAERVFGWSADEVIGRDIAVLIPEGKLAEERGFIESLQRGERVVPFETVRRRKNGELIDVSVTISPIRDARGAIVGASKVARDISDRKRAEEALARAKEATDAANRDLEAFSYSVAHDLRAPLRGIDGFSLALIEDYGDRLDGEGKRYLERVRDSAQHMAQLIESLLALARVTRGDVRRDPVDLSELARATADRLRTSQPDRTVEFAIGSGLVAVGDSRLLGVVLDNLLGNAWKFSRNRADARIEFDDTWIDGRPVFYVRDNGAGFDMAFAAKLFGVFQRLHTTSEFEGTGIGLATVQRIIGRHGGRVWAEGAVGRGATFYFTLNEREP